MFHNYFCVIFNRVAQITFSSQLPARGWEIVLKFRNQGVGCFHFSCFPDLSTTINISRLALNKPLSYLQTSFTSQSSANSSPTHVFFGGRAGRRKVLILKACVSQISKRKLNIFGPLCCTIWLVGRGQLWQFSNDICLFPIADRARGLFCLFKAHCLSSSSLLLSHCLHFVFELLSQVSAVLPFVNTLENIQSAAGARHLPVFILCGTVSKLTDGAVSSICSVNSSGEDGAWMGYFSPLISQQKAAPIYLSL